MQAIFFSKLDTAHCVRVVLTKGHVCPHKTEQRGWKLCVEASLSSVDSGLFMTIDVDYGGLHV